jgi:hypothetical protein
VLSDADHRMEMMRLRAQRAAFLRRELEHAASVACAPLRQRLACGTRSL